MANVEQRERCQLCELEVEGLNNAMFVDEDDTPCPLRCAMSAFRQARNG